MRTSECPKCRGDESLRPCEYCGAEREARRRQDDPYRLAAQAVIAVCCDALRAMPDFAGRTDDHPLGSVEGILRSEAIEALLALDLDAVAATARRAAEETK